MSVLLRFSLHDLHRRHTKQLHSLFWHKQWHRCSHTWGLVCLPKLWILRQFPHSVWLLTLHCSGLYSLQWTPGMLELLKLISLHSSLPNSRKLALRFAQLYGDASKWFFHAADRCWRGCLWKGFWLFRTNKFLHSRTIFSSNSLLNNYELLNLALPWPIRQCFVCSSRIAAFVLILG